MDIRYLPNGDKHGKRKSKKAKKRKKENMQKMHGPRLKNQELWMVYQENTRFSAYINCERLVK